MKNEDIDPDRDLQLPKEYVGLKSDKIKLIDLAELLMVTKPVIHELLIPTVTVYLEPHRHLWRKGSLRKSDDNMVIIDKIVQSVVNTLDNVFVPGINKHATWQIIFALIGLSKRRLLDSW